jgi:hypothetical protein
LLEARSEIGDINRKITALTSRREALARFVVTSEELISDSEKADPYPMNGGGMRSASSIVAGSKVLSGALMPVVSSSSVSLSQNRLWEGIQIVMRQGKRPATVSEIITMLNAHKILIGGDHPRENIRSAITRQEDVFEKVGRGLYALKEWPERIKNMRKDEPLFPDPAEEGGGAV